MSPIHKATLTQDHAGNLQIVPGIQMPDDVARIWFPTVQSIIDMKLRSGQLECTKSLSNVIQSRIFPDGSQITLQGHLGAGKSAVAKILEKELGIQRFSGGTFMRQLAQERGVELVEMNHLAQADSQYDIAADAKQIALGNSGKGFVIDGRVGPYTVPHSLKVLMTADSTVAATRIYAEYLDGANEGRQQEAIYASVNDVLMANNQRQNAEIERYLKFYGFRVEDPRLYDLIIDTTDKTADEVAQIIINASHELEGMHPKKNATGDNVHFQSKF